MSNVTSSASAAGAIDNYGTIENIEDGTFSKNGGSLAGAIYNKGAIESISGLLFEENISLLAIIEAEIFCFETPTKLFS